VPIVLDDFAARHHRLQRHCRLADFLARSGFPLRGGSKQFKRLIPQRLERSQRLAPRPPERLIHRVGFGQLHQGGDRDISPAPQIVDRFGRLVGGPVANFAQTSRDQKGLTALPVPSVMDGFSGSTYSKPQTHGSGTLRRKGRSVSLGHSVHLAA
jgi:hypothetical protein